MADKQQIGEVGVGPIEVCRWPADFPQVETADVVVEAFGCELPDSYLAAMTRRAVAPVWINLEYLSAEAWVEDCHRLPSLRTRCPIDKYFFFPGFTSHPAACSASVICRPREAFDAAAEAEFWQGVGVPPRRKNELRISIFCYANPALSDLLRYWADGEQPITVLATPGPASDQIAAWFGESLVIGTPLRRSSLSVFPLPFLPQTQFDRLLWACDVNFVRGEDSFVRAQWARRPFVWQVYPQSDNAAWRSSTLFCNDTSMASPRPPWHADFGTHGMAAAKLVSLGRTLFHSTPRSHGTRLIGQPLLTKSAISPTIWYYS